MRKGGRDEVCCRFSKHHLNLCDIDEASNERVGLLTAVRMLQELEMMRLRPPDVAVLYFVLVSIALSVQNGVREKSLGGKY